MKRLLLLSVVLLAACNVGVKPNNTSSSAVSSPFINTPIVVKNAYTARAENFNNDPFFEEGSGLKLYQSLLGLNAIKTVYREDDRGSETAEWSFDPSYQVNISKQINNALASLLTLGATPMEYNVEYKLIVKCEHKGKPFKTYTKSTNFKKYKGMGGNGQDRETQDIVDSLWLQILRDFSQDIAPFTTR